MWRQAGRQAVNDTDITGDLGTTPYDENQGVPITLNTVKQ